MPAYGRVMPRSPAHRPAWLLFPIFLAATVPLGAQVTAWNNPIQGDWNVSGNWDNGIPDSTTDVYIYNGATSILNNATGEAKFVKAGFGGSGSLLIENGGHLTAGYVYAGGPGSTNVGVVTVTGPGSALSLISPNLFSHVGQ